MTTRTVYVPRLIESAEQAEALPPSTPIVIGPFIAMRPITEATWGMSYTDGDYSSAELVSSFPDYDLTALVPIEAEEEWGGSRPDGGAWQCQNRSHAESDADGWNRSAGPDGFHSTPVRRLVTPWEEAQ